MLLLRTRLVAILASVALLATASGVAQTQSPRGALRYSFETFGVDEGLESLATMDLVEDRDGDIWIATQEGVVRYDGDRFRTFGQQEGLPSQVVFDLEQDHDGTIWAGTLRGLTRFQESRFVAVDLPGAPHDEAVEALALDGDGKLVVGAVGGVYRCDGPVCQKIFELAADQTVSAIAFDRTHGDLWFAGSFGLVRWNRRTLERYGPEQGLPAMATRAMAVDRFGNLWIRQSRDLVRLDTADGTIRIEPGLPPATDVGHLLVDREGTLWVTSDRGLYARTAGGWQRFGPEQGLPSDGIAAVLEDHEGSLWIGTRFSGLARWVGRGRFVAWSRDAGLPGDVVWAITRSSAGRLALGTEGGLALVEPDGSRLRVLDGSSGLPGSYVLSLAADREGGIWVGLAEGRLAYVDRGGTVLDVGARQEMPRDLSITAIAIGDGQQVWLGTNRGLWEGTGDPAEIRFSSVDLPRPVGPDAAARPTEVVSDLLIDRAGRLWAAGRYGLLRRDRGGWKRLTRADGLLDDYVASLTQTGDGAIWISYRDAHGVTELRGDGEPPSVRHFTTAQGLRHDQVTFVRADALGRLWIGTSRGVSVRVGDRFANYSRADGLLSDDTCFNAFHADRDGTAWIGTPHGAIAARLSTDDLAPRPPPAARILEARLGGVAFAATTRPRVAHGLHDLEIEFSARTFRTPREVEFRHRLIGVDTAPIVTHERRVRYPALAAGSYSFEVAARIVGGSWGEPARFSFTVRPPWWATAPTRVLGVLAIILLGIVAERLRGGHERRRRAQLEREVAERNRELDASRAELGRKSEELAQLELTDPLTGLRNRRYAWEFFSTEVARIDRQWAATPPGESCDANLVFFLLDIDLFKAVNELHGHEVGDQILIEAAERVRHVTRAADVAVRWGGEEFLVVARDLPESEWTSYAARLRQAIADPPFQPRKELGSVSCTSSLGYVAYPFDRAGGTSWHEVLRLAELAQQAVKKTGRNADLGVTRGRFWSGAVPPDLLAAQAAGFVDLVWGRRPAAR